MVEECPTQGCFEDATEVLSIQEVEIALCPSCMFKTIMEGQAECNSCGHKHKPLDRDRPPEGESGALTCPQDGCEETSYTELWDQ